MPDWESRFADAISFLPAMAARAPLTFCGNGACIDARVRMADILPMRRAAPREADRLATLLLERVARGQGGEIAYNWPEGPQWIMQRLPASLAMGGTGPHAAWTLTAAGAPALLALEDRSDLMLSLVPPNVLLAETDRVVPAAAAARRGTPRTPVFIFEYTAGESVGDVCPTRSSRIIVRFGNFPLENDPDFTRLTLARASEAGAGLISGFSSVHPNALRRELDRTTSLARGWRERGLPVLHLELAGFETLDLMRTTLQETREAITSVGMSLSELRTLRGDAPDVTASMMSLGEELGVARVCVHADHWAASVTKRDPETEMQALVMGCLLASCRAGAGEPVWPTELCADVRFADPPFPAIRRAGAWTAVACASPYLGAPRTTLGLGDTFTGGCLLALGAAASRSPEPRGDR